jgi:hypothetical protein
MNTYNDIPTNKDTRLYIPILGHDGDDRRNLKSDYQPRSFPSNSIFPHRDSVSSRHGV